LDTEILNFQNPILQNKTGLNESQVNLSVDYISLVQCKSCCQIIKCY